MGGTLGVGVFVGTGLVGDGVGEGGGKVAVGGRGGLVGVEDAVGVGMGVSTAIEWIGR